MPAPLYNNATLARQEARRRFTGPGEGLTSTDTPQETPAGRSEPSVDDLLNAAKASLGRADQLSAETDSGRLAGLEDNLAALRRPQQGMARKLTNSLEAASTFATPLALVPGPQQPIAAGIAALGAGAGGLRRMIAPEEDESRLGGAIETGLSLWPALKGLKSLVRPAETVVAREMAPGLFRGRPPIRSREIPGGTITDKMAEFMGPAQGATKAANTGASREELAQQLLESSSFKGLRQAATKAANPSAKPTAEFAFDWPEVGKQYHVRGGPYDRSTVGADRLRELGIDVPLSTGELSGTTVSALDEVMRPGAGRFLDRQDRMLGQPEYASTRALLKQVNPPAHPAWERLAGLRRR